MILKSGYKDDLFSVLTHLNFVTDIANCSYIVILKKEYFTGGIPFFGSMK
jgi:hypothetical protein